MLNTDISKSVSCQLVNMKCSNFLLEIDAKNKHSPCSVLMSLIDKPFQLKFNMPQVHMDSLSIRTFQVTAQPSFRTFRLIQACDYNWNLLHFCVNDPGLLKTESTRK